MRARIKACLGNSYDKDKINNMGDAFKGSRFYICHCFLGLCSLSLPSVFLTGDRASLIGKIVVKLWLRLHSLSPLATYGHGFLSTQAFLLVFYSL